MDPDNLGILQLFRRRVATHWDTRTRPTPEQRAIATAASVEPIFGANICSIEKREYQSQVTQTVAIQVGKLRPERAGTAVSPRDFVLPQDGAAATGENPQPVQSPPLLARELVIQCIAQEHVRAAVTVDIRAAFQEGTCIVGDPRIGVGHAPEASAALS